MLIERNKLDAPKNCHLFFFFLSFFRIPRIKEIEDRSFIRSVTNITVQSSSCSAKDYDPTHRKNSYNEVVPSVNVPPVHTFIIKLYS